MISLDSTAMMLQAVLATAANTTQPYSHVWFYDVPAEQKDGTQAYQVGLQRTALNDTTQVTICDAPSVNSTKRHIAELSIVNRSLDTEVITVSTYDGSTRAPVRIQSLSTLASLHYTSDRGGRGWYTSEDSTGGGGTASVSFITQLTENNPIQFVENLSADGKYSGFVSDGDAGETLAFGECVYLKSDGLWWKAKADSTTTSGGVKLGICVLAGSGATKILLFGNVRADSLFPTFTKGAAVYVSAATAGVVTQTAPSSTDQVIRVVGHGWYSGDELFFTPSPDYSTHT